MEKLDMRYWGMIAGFLKRDLFSLDRVSKHRKPRVARKAGDVRKRRAKNKVARGSRRVNHILARGR